MENATGIRRFSCFVSDVSLLMGLYYLSFKIAENLVPPADLYPPVSAMQLFSPGDFAVFFRASVIGGLFYLGYHFFCYFVLQRTIGQILTQIKRVSLLGENLRTVAKIKVIFTGFLKYLLIFLPGPALAFLGLLGFAFSLLALILPVLFLFINPLLCYVRADKLSWFEKITKTKIIAVSSSEA